jgi:diguanylate cyclase (GGDEF)-like protein
LICSLFFPKERKLSLTESLKFSNGIRLLNGYKERCAEESSMLPEPEFPIAKARHAAAKWLLLSVILTTLGFLAVCASVVWDMKQAAWEIARQASENLASTMDADIARNIELYDLSLRAVATNMALPEINQVSKPIRRLILFDHAATANHFGSLKVYDANGTLTIDAAALSPENEQVADKEYFKVHATNPNVGLFIDKPSSSRLGEYSIILSRRISNSDGTFAGVVTGAFHLSYFYNLFRRVNAGEDGTITLVRRDGVVIMRTPFDLAFLGKNLSNGANTRRVLSGEGGWFEGLGAVDKIERQFVWSDGKQPMVVIVGKSLNAIYGPWESEALKISALTLALTLSSSIAIFFLLREMRKRTALEQKLAILSLTDGLTGLNNRRRFDEVLRSEWERSLRQGTSIALLMIDADHFKAYNDAFGHQAGDQVLSGIASCISSRVRRSADCAARYGGEEFAIILPGLTALDAQIVAERIRLDVEKLPSEKSVATVSIGIASVIPASSQNAADLIAFADAALYQAKDGGRNRCVVASKGSLSLVA